MSQQVSDLLEWRTALCHPAGYRVPKNMRAAHSLLQPAAFGSVTYRVSYDVEGRPQRSAVVYDVRRSRAVRSAGARIADKLRSPGRSGGVAAQCRFACLCHEGSGFLHANRYRPGTDARLPYDAGPSPEDSA